MENFILWLFFASKTFSSMLFSLSYLQKITKVLRHLYSLVMKMARQVSLSLPFLHFSSILCRLRITFLFYAKLDAVGIVLPEMFQIN